MCSGWGKELVEDWGLWAVKKEIVECSGWYSRVEHKWWIYDAVRCSSFTFHWHSTKRDTFIMEKKRERKTVKLLKCDSFGMASCLFVLIFIELLMNCEKSHCTLLNRTRDHNIQNFELNKRSIIMYKWIRFAFHSISI